jgi:hypothetical protein
MSAYTEQNVTWRGINLKVRHCPRWLDRPGEFVTQHIEVVAEGREPLPITETGYRSCFLNGAGAIKEWGDDPVKFVFDWLDKEAQSPNWKVQRQLDLF